MEFHGRRVTVMGLGHFGGGLAAARWLARRGAEVTVTDTADEAALAEAIAELRSEPIAAWHLGGHREDDFQQADLVVVNPAVRPDDRFVETARRQGVRISTEIGLLLEQCPATVLGVTGSNGKSTTAAMTAAILQAAGKRTWLGGNIGGSLLPRLPEIGPPDYVVLELSSFQLWYLRESLAMPHVAVVTNFSPNHLDWHGSLDHYRTSKQTLVARQTAADFAVLNPHDASLVAWMPLVGGQLAAVPPLDTIPPLSLPGEHNRINAACAVAAARCVGCSDAAIHAGLRSFRALPQRLELCATGGGRRFYNDSTATTPESAIATLSSLDGPLWLLAGGKDKGFSFDAFSEAVIARAAGAAFFGNVREKMRAEVLRRCGNFACVAMETMDEALAWCFASSATGDAIVLSPACASTDQFRNFRERGEHFASLARGYAREVCSRGLT